MNVDFQVRMAVNQNSEIRSDAASLNNSDSSRLKMITVRKLNVNSVSNSNINGSTHHQNEIATNSNSTPSVINSEDQNSSNIKTLNAKLCDVGDKGEHLQQLSTNALPPYTPTSPPRFIKQDVKSIDVHCCTDCGDTFALKSSLNFHLERRSVLIKYPCEVCKTTCIFYNRCNLLSHIRSHIDQNEKSDIGKAIVTVLPRVFMDGIQNEFVNTLDDELNSIDDNDNLPPSEMLECSLHELDNSTAPPVSEKDKTESEPIITKLKCLDCNEEFESAYDRKEHLTNGDKMPVPVTPCDKCGFVCPSKCSLKAHQRIHLQISPYVCPECGESPDPHWTNFINHVNFQCFHNARSIGYKCPVCSKLVSPNNQSLLKHMELHTEKYAKCSKCPRAYNSTQAFKAHNNLYHDGATVQYTMIFKCSLCDIVFVSNDQMLNHRSTHLKEQVCEYVFNCMQCGKPLESKALLQDHIRTMHPKTYKQAQMIESTDKPAKTTVQYRGNVECLICNSIFYSQQGYSVHVARAHINVNQKCNFCLKVIPNRKEMVKHGKLHLQDKNALCLLCNNKKFDGSQELESHLDNHIKKLKFCSFCPICDRLFPTLSEALNHLRVEHYLPLKGFNSSTKPIPNTVCHFCRDSFVSIEELQAHLKIKHNIDGQSCRSDESGDPPLKKQRTVGNTCAKCQFQCEVRGDFKKHILSHKSNSATFQCQECGLCFIVQPSLCKHLRIVHKISDTMKYIKEEGTNYVPEKENETETSRHSALECSVCFTSFPNEGALKTHMRSHGMAFIQANKSGLL